MFDGVFVRPVDAFRDIVMQTFMPNESLIISTEGICFMIDSYNKKAKSKLKTLIFLSLSYPISTIERSESLVPIEAQIRNQNIVIDN